MTKKLFMLALSLTVVTTMSAPALAGGYGGHGGQGGQGQEDPQTTGNGSPVLGEDANVEQSALGSFNNNDVDVDLTKTVTKTTTKTETDIEDSYNTKNEKKIEDSFNTKTETKTEIEDSYNTKNESKIEDSYNTKKETKIEDSYNHETKNEDSYNDIRTKGDQSPAMSNSEIEDSNFGAFSSTGDASPNLQDSKIDDSWLVGGNVDQSKHIDQQGQLNAANSDVWVGNMAGDDSTIFDGDVSFGGGKGGHGGGGLLDVGFTTANVNTGIMQDSIMGDNSAQMNGAGVAVNGDLGGAGSSECCGAGAGFTINNTQTSNYNLLGGTK